MRCECGREKHPDNKFCLICKDKMDFELSKHIEEGFYGIVGTSDCHKVGICGLCGLDCWVYLEGRCKEPDEMINRFECDEDRGIHNELYGSK